MLQTMMTRSVYFAELGCNMSYAVYAAAKLNQAKHIPALVSSLEMQAHRANILDVQSVLWGCAKVLETPAGLDAFLDRLETIISAHKAVSRNQEPTWRVPLRKLTSLRDESNMDTVSASPKGMKDTQGSAPDGAATHEASAAKGKRGRPVESASGLRHGEWAVMDNPPAFEPWVISQIAWSIAELHLMERQSCVVYIATIMTCVLHCCCPLYHLLCCALSLDIGAFIW